MAVHKAVDKMTHLRRNLSGVPKAWEKTEQVIRWRGWSGGLAIRRAESLGKENEEKCVFEAAFWLGRMVWVQLNYFPRLG